MSPQKSFYETRSLLNMKKNLVLTFFNSATIYVTYWKKAYFFLSQTGNLTACDIFKNQKYSFICKTTATKLTASVIIVKNFIKCSQTRQEK